MLQRFHHRGRGRGRLRLRGGSDRSSSPERPERHLDAGNRLLRERLDAGILRHRGDLRRLGAGNRRHPDAGLQLPDGVHRVAANRDVVPAGEGCCSGSGAGPFPGRSQTGCFPVEGSPDAVPFPERSRTGCFPVEVHPGGVLPGWPASQPNRVSMRLLLLQERPAFLLLESEPRQELLGSAPQRPSLPERQELPEPVLAVLPPRASRREPELGQAPEWAVTLAWQPSWPRGPSPSRWTALRRPLRGQREACARRGVRWLMRAT
jgi:hypothetical protein